jgi:hypothetical protein
MFFVAYTTTTTMLIASVMMLLAATGVHAQFPPYPTPDPYPNPGPIPSANCLNYTVNSVVCIRIITEAENRRYYIITKHSERLKNFSPFYLSCFNTGFLLVRDWPSTCKHGVSSLDMRM